MGKAVRWGLNLFLNSEDSRLDEVYIAYRISFFEQNQALFETNFLKKPTQLLKRANWNYSELRYHLQKGKLLF